MNTTLTAPVTCRRCSGKGIVNSPVDFGRCFKCYGAGQVEGDKATIAARKAYAVNRSALGKAAFEAGHAAHSGLSHLEVHAPARLAAAVASFAAGDARVVPALVAYFEAL